VFGNFVAFPTPEKYLGRDLDGDGELNDTVLRYVDLTTCHVFNTGIPVSGRARSIDISDSYIVFADIHGRIMYYDLSTHLTYNTGLRGSQPSVVDNTIIFEAFAGGIIGYDIEAHTAWPISPSGRSPSASKDWVAFIDGDPPTLHLYEMATHESIDTGFPASRPYVSDNVVAFECNEYLLGTDVNGDRDTSDIIIQYYVLSTGELVNTRLTGFMPAVGGKWLVFASLYPPKEAEAPGRRNPTPLPIICYYDLEAQTAFSTGKYGTEPDVDGNIITYYVWEFWAQVDLNGDGDEEDPVVRVYRIPPP